MVEAENRALLWAVAILFATSVGRVAWSHARRDDGGPTVAAAPADSLLAESRAALKDAEARARPLAPDERIDPNRATAAELDRLPGVGPSTAEAIVRSRERDGPFPDAASLARVRGIGAATLARIADHLDVTAPPPAFGARRPPGPRAHVVDVNHADEATLQTLPGVGPALAKRIVQARGVRPFRSVADLERVRGIGPATLARLEGRIGFGPR